MKNRVRQTPLAKVMDQHEIMDRIGDCRDVADYDLSPWHFLGTIKGN